MMRIFYENAWFICGMDSLPGTLAQTDIDNLKEGFISFVRLVGLAFFKKHLSCFVHDTPRVLYSSLADPALSHYDMHKRFLQTIRDMVWDKIQFEDELPPSMAALVAYVLGVPYVESGC